MNPRLASGRSACVRDLRRATKWKKPTEKSLTTRRECLLRPDSSKSLIRELRRHSLRTGYEQVASRWASCGAPVPGGFTSRDILTALSLTNPFPKIPQRFQHVLRRKSLTGASRQRTIWRPKCRGNVAQDILKSLRDICQRACVLPAAPFDQNSSLASNLSKSTEEG